MKKPTEKTTTVPVSLLIRATDIIKRQQALLQELARKLESKNA